MRRVDLALIMPWIAHGARVLDLGCGDGDLLGMLRVQRDAEGLGVDIDHEHIRNCVAAGIPVIEQDLNEGLGNFGSGSFDLVVMTNALQTLRYPHHVLDEMLRIGREVIVTFPNFGHWSCRLHLALQGRMPVSKFMPYTWYDTPNIHFCTVRDFDILCAERNIRVLDRLVLGADHTRNAMASRWPNLFGTTAAYHIAR